MERNGSEIQKGTVEIRQNEPNEENESERDCTGEQIEIVCLKSSDNDAL